MTPISKENIEYKSPEIERFYREHRTRWDHFYESERIVFERLGFDETTSVLDIGCGCGGLGLALRERFGVTRYTGIEINRQAAEAASAVCPWGRFLAADILAPPPGALQTAAFDVVVSLGCIDWNVRFEDMLASAFAYVRKGGHFVSSFRLTRGESQVDMRQSFQYINFDGKQEGEIAPYVVLSTADLLARLTALEPERIGGFGYWGRPSPTAVTPCSEVGFVVVAVRKGEAPTQRPVIDLDVPADLLPSRE
jgi:SAM-dependent methyltransferase